MCGIAGFCEIGLNILKNKNEFENILNDMNKAQKHRGPDEDGIFMSDFCGLCHTRLSIVDAENGKQPMSISFGEKHYVIVYSGEIYNAAELKMELKAKGAYFKTNSDTELILLGHIIFGENFVKKLNGMFSYALWDDVSKSLFIYRDRLGIKPLFYTIKDNFFIFACEIKALFKYPGVEKKIDREGLCEIFGLGPAKTPGKGVFKDVFELLPGHYLKLNKNGVKNISYWNLKSVHHKDSLEQTIYKTSYLVKEAIKKNMVSDTPICTFLSGGIDSSLVTAIASLEYKKIGFKLNTFSFDYVDNNKYFKSNMFQPSQDRPWVDKVVSFLKTNHTYLECDTKDIVDGLFKAVLVRDLPCMADVESSLLYFCSKVAEKNRVALTGECADEIFGGYPWFYREEMFKAESFPWALNFESRNELFYDGLVDDLRINEYVKTAYEKTIKQTPKLYGESDIESRRRELSFLNLKWFMQNLLDRMDRTSMYSGLEARVPFADHEVVEYVFNIPWDIKCCGGFIKGLLRRAGISYLPEEVIYRKKNPYPKIYNPKYEDILKDLMLSVVYNNNSPICNFVDRKKVEKFFETPLDYKKPWYGQLMAGPQLIAYMLQINYWFLKYKVEIV